MTATIHEVDGKLVLNDPTAAAVIRAVNKKNCRITFDEQADRVEPAALGDAGSRRSSGAGPRRGLAWTNDSTFGEQPGGDQLRA